ncbi:MAG: hypothetical protein V3S17_01255 [candidate division Zixibacteria bacterium]
MPNSDALFRPGVVVMLGEFHGTEQAPAAVMRMTCNALEHGPSVIVGLQIQLFV